MDSWAINLPLVNKGNQSYLRYIPKDMIYSFSLVTLAGKKKSWLSEPWNRPYEMLLRPLISDKGTIQTKDIKPLLSLRWESGDLIFIQPWLPRYGDPSSLFSFPFPTNSQRLTKTRCEKRWDTDANINSSLCDSDCSAMRAPTHVKCTVHSEKSRTHGADFAQVPEMELG